MKLGIFLIVSCICIYGYILVSDTRVLLKETKVEVGDNYIQKDYGNLGDLGQASLVCKYFNGRKVLDQVLWYSSSNSFGRDSCPFIMSGH